MSSLQEKKNMLEKISGLALTLLHSEWPKLHRILGLPKLHRVLAVLSAIGLNLRIICKCL